MSFKDKVVFVTGASRGIGKAIAMEFAKGGAKIIINFINDSEKSKNTIEEMKNLGIDYLVLKGDVSKGEFCKEAIEKIIATYGNIDVLINNAGISHFGMVIDMTEDEYSRVMDTNFKSVFNMSKEALKYMMYQKSGVILNISSMWGREGASCEVLYSASKGAVDTSNSPTPSPPAVLNCRCKAPVAQLSVA